MPLDFPSNPANGQTYNNFYYDGTTGAWRSLGSVYAPNYLKNATFTTTTSSGVPLTIQGVTSQSGNLQEWKNSSGNVLLNVSSDGSLFSSKQLYTSGKVVGTTQPDAGSDGGVAVRAPASGTQTSAYLQFVNNAYSVQYGSISADPNGYLTLSGTGVKIPNQPAFFVGRTASTNVGNTILFDLVKVNIGSNYNSSTGRFTAPVSGTYYFGAGTIGATSGTSRIQVKINNSTFWGNFHIRSINTANYADAEVTFCLTLAAGDYVTLYVQEGTAYDDGTGYTHWTGHLIG